jgi:hypothetical protein
MGRELDVHKCLASLKKKRCEYVPPTLKDPSTYLDISKADRLGKGSWGMIDFLQKSHILIIGKIDYLSRDF